MNPDAIGQWMKDNSIKEIRALSTGEFLVILTCQGFGGYGETVSDALDDARQKNAGFLEEVE